MSKIKQANENIQNTVVEGFNRIEAGVTEGYKKIEDGVVSAYKKVEDKFVDTFLARDGETTEEAKARITHEQARS